MREGALQLTPDGHPDKALRLGSLGSPLWTRYQCFGDVDLEKSMSRTVHFTPDGHQHKGL